MITFAYRNRAIYIYIYMKNSDLDIIFFIMEREIKKIYEHFLYMYIIYRKKMYFFKIVLSNIHFILSKLKSLAPILSLTE